MNFKSKILQIIPKLIHYPKVQRLHQSELEKLKAAANPVVWKRNSQKQAPKTVV